MMSPFVVLPTSSSAPFASQPQAGPAGYRYIGEAPAQLPVLLSIALPLRNTGELTSIVKQVSDPASPQFRHFMTQAAVRDEFLPTGAFDAMLSRLAQDGLTPLMTAMDSVIVVAATAGQLKQLFGAGVSLYGNGTSSYYATAGSDTFEGAYLYASNLTSLYARPAFSRLAAAEGNTTFSISSFNVGDLAQVYNASQLSSQGYDGAGQTVGVLDFYGSPTIQGDVSKFDRQFGYPAPELNVVPVGPYQPNLGAAVGWNVEVALDVEFAHAMAPAARLDLYVLNPALNLVDAISKVVQDGGVASLSQSFSIPEWVYSELPPAAFVFNALLPDYYYMLGAIKGITFTAASGDTGGMGESNGPEGALGYPASSPYVTAVGGTSTYVDNAPGGVTWAETAWSNLGFVPNGVNYGGSTGGVSVLEAKPWYQDSVASPPSFPYGRLVPDVALQASPYPGTAMVAAGKEFIVGGTSVSSPLLAGLLALVSQKLKGGLGLVNPSLYYLGEGGGSAPAPFNPITFGYSIPWTASAGYNLVTGWGSPNIGEIASDLVRQETSPLLSVSVNATGGFGPMNSEFAPNSTILISANVTDSGMPVATGAFDAAVSTLSGPSRSEPLTFDPSTGTWRGSLQLGEVSGVAHVRVQGSSGSTDGSGFATIFAGYWGRIESPNPTDPWDFGHGQGIKVSVRTLDGAAAPAQDLIVSLLSYGLRSNVYREVAAYALPARNATVYQMKVNASLPSGPATLALEGSVYGYLPFMSGIYLQNSFIYPQLVVEPGAVYPGQSITLVANPVAPYNVYSDYSLETGSYIGADVAVGSNVTARLYNPSGSLVSSSTLKYGDCAQAVKGCRNGAKLNGYLRVPPGASPGLYTVILTANYSSITLGYTLDGSFIGQVWVSGGGLYPAISVSPAALYEGERASLTVSIDYPDGSPVTQGMFTASAYPAQLGSDLSAVTHALYSQGGLVALSYDPARAVWTGSLTLPSPYSQDSAAPLANGTTGYAGPYGLFVSGISYDGFPTSSGPSSQQGFVIQPYAFFQDSGFGGFAPSSGFALANATLSASGTFSNDMFLGSVTISGQNVTLRSSQVEGTLFITGSTVALVGVTGGDIVAQDSTVVLIDSTVGRVSLTRSTLRVDDSSYSQVAPAQPTIDVRAPSLRGDHGVPFSASADVTGEAVSAVEFLVDGSPLGTPTNSSGVYSASIDPASMADGVHSLTVRVTQSDGIVTTATTTFSTDAELAAQGATLAGVYYLLAALAVATVTAVVVSMVALMRRRTAAGGTASAK
jgi:subtilase family serine protease